MFALALIMHFYATHPILIVDTGYNSCFYVCAYSKPPNTPTPPPPTR